MVKIPEMPGGYKPGDVVNGHVLTERGHWVPVAGESAPTHGPAPQVSESAAAPSSAPVHAANPAPTHTPNPYLKPAPPRPAAGGTTTRTTTSKGTALFGCAVIAVVVIIFVVVIVVMVNQFRSSVADAAPVPGWSVDRDDDPIIEDPLDGFETLPEAPSWTLTDEERELFEVVDWEVFHGDYSSHFLVTVAAPGLTRPHAGTIVQLTAVDSDGVTHEGSDFVWLDEGAPTLAVGFFDGQFTADVVELTAEFQPLGVENEPNPYTVEITGHEVSFEALRPRVAVTLEAGAYGEPPPAMRLTVVVRDAEGHVINLGLGYPLVPGLGETTSTDLYLWGEASVPDDATWELSLMSH